MSMEFKVKLKTSTAFFNMESFKADHRKAFHGKALCVIQSKQRSGIIRLTATSAGLAMGVIEISSK